MRGVRIQNIVNELNGEKIDVVEWNEDPARYVANALSPAQVVRVTVDEDSKTATVVVPERQLSLAIGKEGQNARLAAKLTGWRIDIKSEAAMRAAAERAREETEDRRPGLDEAGAGTGARRGRRRLGGAVTRRGASRRVVRRPDAATSHSPTDVRRLPI